jgi:SAM-dependent methyltransferase
MGLKRRMALAFKPRYDRCPLCDHDNAVHSHDLEFENETINWDRCCSCGLTFQNPPMTAATTRECYRRSNYFSVAYSDYTSLDHVRMKQSKRRLTLIECLRPLGRRLLDVGSASGFFGAVAKARGYNVTCIEPDETMSAYGRDVYGLDMRTCTVEACDLERHSFDIVTLWGTDSHFEHPLMAFQKLAGALRPGGIFAMTYQAFDHPIRWLFPKIKVSWNVMFALTDRSFDVLLERIGLTLIERRNTEWQWTTIDHVLRSVKAPTLGRISQIPIMCPAISYRLVATRKI